MLMQKISQLILCNKRKKKSIKVNSKNKKNHSRASCLLAKHRDLFTDNACQEQGIKNS